MCSEAGREHQHFGMQAGIRAGAGAEQGIKAAGEKIGHIVGRHRLHVIGRALRAGETGEQVVGLVTQGRRDAEAERLRL